MNWKIALEGGREKETKTSPRLAIVESWPFLSFMLRRRLELSVFCTQKLQKSKRRKRKAPVQVIRSVHSSASCTFKLFATAVVIILSFLQLPLILFNHLPPLLSLDREIQS